MSRFTSMRQITFTVITIVLLFVIMLRTVSSGKDTKLDIENQSISYSIEDLDIDLFQYLDPMFAID